jgi:predicted RNase H-like HicB family nuclease
LKYAAVVTKTGNIYVAMCPQTGTMAGGPSPDEALTKLKDSTELFLYQQSGRLGIPQVGEFEVIDQSEE